MSEKRFSIIFFIFSQILVFRYLLSLYINASLLWIPVGISFALLLMIFITNEKSIYLLTNNFILSRKLQVIIYLFLCSIYTYSCLIGLILLARAIPINDYSFTIAPLSATFICILGSIVGITQKLFFSMGNAKY